MLFVSKLAAVSITERGDGSEGAPIPTDRDHLVRCSQAAPVALMIVPVAFSPNPETAQDNAFQTSAPEEAGAGAALARQAGTEVRAIIKELESAGVAIVAGEGLPGLPDDVFPNNWFSTHVVAEGREVAVLYPMRHASRRPERRPDIVAALRRHFGEENVIDLTHFEAEDKALESTGAMVIDNVHHVIYAARSERMHEDVLSVLVDELNRRGSDPPFSTRVFDAALPDNDAPIYHTNVMMWIGTSVAGVCLDSIRGSARDLVATSLSESGRTIVEFSPEQIRRMAGNMFEMRLSSGDPALVLSKTAEASLSAEQREQLARAYSTGKMVTVDCSTLEMAGGSIRCALAGLFSDDTRGLVRELVANLGPHAVSTATSRALSVPGSASDEVCK